MRLARIAVLLVLLFAAAQAADGVSVTVTVIDGGSVGDDPIEGALVELGSELSSNTDEDGQAYFESVPEGTHALRVEASGYKSVSREVSISSESSEIRIKLFEE